MCLLRKAIVLWGSLLFCLSVFTQKHNFISYNIDEGLPQSAVVNLLQDNDRHIWTSSGGGISRFDGKKFTNYGTDEGLSENNVLQITIDQQQRIWAATNSGLNLIHNNKVTVYPFPEMIKGNRVHLLIDKNDKLWCLLNGTVYSFAGNKFAKEELKGLVNYDFSLFFRDKQKDIYLLNASKEIYKFQNNRWSLFASLHQIDSMTRVSQVCIDSMQNILALTSTCIFKKSPGTDQLVRWFEKQYDDVFFRCMNFDKWGNLWIGTTKGAFKVRPNRSSDYFHHWNGFSDNWINHVFPDIEGNIWLATEGSGVFKYTGGIFTSFDNTSGYFSSGVFAMARYDSTGIVLGHDGIDFCIYDGKAFTYPLVNTAAKNIKYIYTTYASPGGTIWIGTLGDGIWKYKNGKAEKTGLTAGSVLGIYGEGEKVLFATTRGAFVYEEGEFKRIDTLNETIRNIISLSKDSILISTASNIFLVKNGVMQSYVFPGEYRKNTLAALERNENKVFIGTLGAGIFIWDRQNGTLTKFTKKNGLSSDFVYSLRFDHSGQLWAGTGKGVSKINSTDNFTTITVHNYGKEQGFTGLECNQNAITVMDDNSVWFGAVKGAYQYHPEEDKQTTSEPRLVLQSIKLFSKPLLPGMYSDSTSWSAFYPVPENLALSSANNHVTFEFSAITFKNANVRYSYYLKGLERNYSTPDQTNFVVYPSLPPGSYTFHVRMIDEAGKELGEPVAYDFTINPAFYQTLWFKFLIVMAIAGIILAVYTLRKRYHVKQKKLIQQLRMEEQNKIRVKTAQDFHDEMGNKLARITVLSDILKSKLPANEEAQGIAKKIQDNASLLYQGTKDIIWSLNPRNDNLYNLMMHVNDFAVDLFHDTDIEFDNVRINRDLNHYFLPMDHARNVMMICKEALTNILKHSQASEATIDTGIIAGNRVRIIIADNGKGFNDKEIEYGNGLHNIRQRVEYLNGIIDIESNSSTGTQIILTIGIPTNGALRNGVE